MTSEQEKPRKERFPCHGRAGLFLADSTGGIPVTERLHGELIDISCHGASLALSEIITDRKHMAYTPMESDEFTLYIVLYLEDGELVVPVHTSWFNKKLSEEELPFRIGMEFLKPILTEQLKKIRAS